MTSAGCSALAARQSSGDDADDDHQQRNELAKQGGIDIHERSFFMGKCEEPVLYRLGCDWQPLNRTGHSPVDRFSLFRQ